MKIIWKGIDWLARAVIGLIAKISPKLGDACLKLWENTELVSYLFVGVATTLVNYVAYFLATRTAGMSVMAGTWTAWVIAVAFGYVANKIFVFKTHCESTAALLRRGGELFHNAAGFAGHGNGADVPAGGDAAPERPGDETAGEHRGDYPELRVLQAVYF